MTIDPNDTQLRTFLIARIKDLLQIAQRDGEDGAAAISQRFASAVRETILPHAGELVEMHADEALVTFRSARQALRAAATLQVRIRQLPMGIGLDAGEVVHVADGYRGRALNLASRLSVAASPGEVLASEGVVHLAGALTELEYGEPRELQVKGFEAPVGVVPVRSRRVSASAPVAQSGGTASEPGLRVQLLGGFSLVVGVREIPADGWRLRKSAMLVKLLALEPGYRMHRERLIDLLWPDAEPASASNNLHHALHVARRSLDPDSARGSEYLRLQGDVLSLTTASGLWVDVEAFEAAASEARRSGDPEKYRAAVALYAGDLLPQDIYDERFHDRRRALRTSFLGLLIELARLEESRRSFGAAIDALRRATMSEPGLEEAHVGLMRLYARTGQRQQALRQYEQLEEALASGSGREPDAATKALYREVLAGKAPIVTRDPLDGDEQEPDTVRHNLPAPLTSFIGRTSDIADIRNVLGTTRLLTLVGAGGAGKTRLATVVARGVLDAFADGVWLVELAPVRDPSLATLAVARALGISEEAGRPLSQTILEKVRDREMLVILDNCEHVIDRCALLAEEMLASCPRLRIMATSREPLDVPGEVTWLVPPLSLPLDDSTVPVEEIAAAESVQLFIDRARYRQPSFGLTPDNAYAVARICREVDGIPLAVELAAARVGVLSVEGIADRLVNALGLLTGGSRTGAPHHQTLRATLDWSYNLLDSAERELFMRLSVFAGGWTLDGAETVGSGGSLEPGDILDVLSQLVDKSWVVAEEIALHALESDGGGTIRYRMLEPIRQYAREHLVRESLDPDMPARSHALLFLALAEDAEYRLRGPDQRAWLARLEREHANLQAALGWLIEHSRLEAATRLALALERFWLIRSHASEAYRWFTVLLDTAVTIDPRLRARLLLAASIHLDTFERTLAADDEALALARRVGDTFAETVATFHAGYNAVAQGDTARAEALYVRAQELARAIADDWERGYCLTGVAGLAYLLKRFDESEALYTEIREIMTALGDPRALGVVQTALGINALMSGDRARARPLLEEALDLCERSGDRANWIQAMVMLARLRADEGDIAQSAAGLREVLPRAARLGAWGFVVISTASVATLALQRGLDERAAALLGAVSRSYREFGQPPLPSEGDYTRGLIAMSKDRLDAARWSGAWDLGESLDKRDFVPYVLGTLDLLAPATVEAEKPDPGENILSGREREVAALIAQGLTNRQIAAKLVISERTADTHVGRILNKLGLSSRAQVAAWVTAQGGLA